MSAMPGPARQKPRESVVERIDREEREVQAARVEAAKHALAPARAQAAAALAELLAFRAEVDDDGVAALDWAARVVSEDWLTRSARYGLPAAADRLNHALSELIQLASDGLTHRGPCGLAVCRRVLGEIDELTLEDVAAHRPVALQADAAACAEYPRAARAALALARSEYAAVTAKVARRMAERGPQPDPVAVAVDPEEPAPPFESRRVTITSLGARA